MKKEARHSHTYKFLRDFGPSMKQTLNSLNEEKNSALRGLLKTGLIAGMPINVALSLPVTVAMDITSTHSVLGSYLREYAKDTKTVITSKKYDMAEKFHLVLLGTVIYGLFAPLALTASLLKDVYK